jgi:hypothetical protein
LVIEAQRQAAGRSATVREGVYRCLGDRIATAFQLAAERVAAARQYQHAVEAHGVGSKAVRAIEQDALRCKRYSQQSVLMNRLT